MSIDRSVIPTTKSPHNLLNELISKLEEIDNKKNTLSFFIGRQVSEKLHERIMKVKDHEIQKMAEIIFKQYPMEIYNEEEFSRLTTLFSQLFTHDFISYLHTTNLIIDQELKDLLIESCIKYNKVIKNENKNSSSTHIDLLAIQTEIITMLEKCKQPFGAYDAEIVNILIMQLDDKNKFYRAIEIIGALGVNLQPTLKIKLTNKLILLLDKMDSDKELSILCTLGKLKQLDQLPEYFQKRFIFLVKNEFPCGIINAETMNRYEVALEVLGWLGTALSPLHRNTCIDILLEAMNDSSKTEQKIILKSLKKIILSMNEKEQIDLKDRLQSISSDSATIFLGQLLMTSPQCNNINPYKFPGW